MSIVGTKARSPAELVQAGRPLTLERVADGAEGLVLADLARAIAVEANAPATSLLVVCRDGPRMAQLARALAFFAPDIAALEFPAWDCQPYDRASPHAATVAQRMTALSRLARRKSPPPAPHAPQTYGDRVWDGFSAPFHRLRLAERPPHPASPRTRGEVKVRKRGRGREPGRRCCSPQSMPWSSACRPAT
jgi:hypothetical protein